MLIQAAVVAAIAGGVYVDPITTAGTIATIAFLYAYYAYTVYGWWEDEFSGHRLTRRDKKSPSNLIMPDVIPLEKNKETIMENSKYHEAYDEDSLLHDVKDMKVTRKENTIFRERAMRSGTLTPNKLRSKSRVGSVLGSLNMVEKAEEMDMDHIYVGYRDFLWAFTFIGPFSFLLHKRRTFMLQIRDFLARKGIIKMVPCDYAKECATLLLEQTQAINYYARRGNIAGFFFANFPYVDEDCEYCVADLFSCEVDLDTKKLVKARMDDMELTPKEALIVLWFHTISAQHVKLHAMANWGCNVDKSLDDVNPFLRQSSVVTVMYNYFGFTSFNTNFTAWEAAGLSSPGWTGNQKPLVQVFTHGIKNNVWQHAQIEDLVKYSEFVHFVVKTRSIFLAEFQKHKAIFPGVNGEALFVGTVLHSLDHTLMDWNLKDPLWLDVDCPKFGKMAEVGRIVKVGFVSDVPGLMFHKRFKGSGHPFYESVYEKAARINKKLADNMDTCIIK